jgi:hypothetical protein
MKALILLLLFPLCAFGQAYTVVEIVAPNPLQTSPLPGGPGNGEFYSGYAPPYTLFTGAYTQAAGCNAAGVCAGEFTYQGINEAAVWLNGLASPATNLNVLSSVYLYSAYAIDAQGNIFAQDKVYDAGPAPRFYVLIPNMQAQVAKAQASSAYYFKDAAAYLNDDLLAQRDNRYWRALVATCRANAGRC